MMVTPKHGRRYPWRLWFDSSPVRLRQGVDYNGRTDTMAVQVRNAAFRFGVRVSIHITPDQKSLTLTVVS